MQAADTGIKGVDCGKSITTTPIKLSLSLHFHTRTATSLFVDMIHIIAALISLSIGLAVAVSNSLRSREHLPFMPFGGGVAFVASAFVS